MDFFLNECPSLCLVISFDLKSILIYLLYIKIIYTCLLLVSVFLDYFFFMLLPWGSVYLWCLFLMVMCVSWMHNKNGSCFLIQSVSLYLFIGGVEMRSLILRFTNKQCLSISLILTLLSILVRLNYCSENDLNIQCIKKFFMIYSAIAQNK